MSCNLSIGPLSLADEIAPMTTLLTVDTIVKLIRVDIDDPTLFEDLELGFTCIVNKVPRTCINLLTLILGLIGVYQNINN